MARSECGGLSCLYARGEKMKDSHLSSVGPLTGREGERQKRKWVRTCLDFFFLHSIYSHLGRDGMSSTGNRDCPLNGTEHV